MKNMKFWRTALVATLVLTVMLSVTGGTIAWFTDSVESGTNVIKSGNLDVELEYSKDFTTWDSVKDTSDLFSTQLWEPGHTDVVYLRISNQGSLALKYLLSMNFTETEGTNVAGETFKLSDSLKYAVVDADAAYANRNAARNAVKDTAATLAAYKSNGELLETNSSKTVAVVVYMPEEVGNEANHKTGTAAPVINLGIKLEAFQKDYESDAFGNDYDANASIETVETDDGLILKTDQVTGETYLYQVTEKYTADTLNVPEGVDRIGNYAFAYNNSVKTVILPSTVRDLGRGFDSSTVEKVVLNEGLTTISSRAFRRTYNLQEVVIPSTVTSIADNAFQSSGIKNIVIPESVTSIGDACFTASTVESVTIMGKAVYIDHYAFRACPNLTSVTILSDTITLGSGMIFTNTENNNQDPNNITIYVYSEDVNATLESNSDVKCSIVLLQPLSTSDDLADAISAGTTTVVLSDGTYTLPATKDNDIVIVGNGETVIDLTEATGQNLAGTDITFSNVTVQGTNSNYIGIQHAGDIVYNNVVFNDSITLYGTSETFNNCTFNLSSRYVWTYGAGEVNFNNCTFNTTGKGLLVYKEAGAFSQTVNINNCTFNATEKGYTSSNDHCAAVEIDSSLITGTYTVNFTGTNTVDEDFAGAWRIKNDGGKNNVTINVDGVKVNN